MCLVVGQKYEKQEFGIKDINRSEHTVGGKLYTFFNIGAKYNNFFENDGFVYEGRAPYVIIPESIKTDLHRYVFVRKPPQEAKFTYCGKGEYECRYNTKSNKIFGKFLTK